jgi:hypothetical protein
VKRASLPAQILLLALLAVGPAVSPAAGQSATVGETRCAVFTVHDLSPNADTREYQQTITDAIVAAFREAGFALVPEAGEDGWAAALEARGFSASALLSEGPALQVAASVRARLAVIGTYAVGNDEVYYSVQCWDVPAGRMIAAVEEATPFNLALFSSLSQTLADELLPAVTAIITAEKEPSRITFVSTMEGMQVLLSGETDIGRIADGRLTYPLEVPVPGPRVVVEKRRKGYHTARQTVVLEPGKEIVLTPLAREFTAGLELDWTLGQLLGLGWSIRGYGSPDWLFIHVSGYTYLQPPASFAPRALIHSDMSVGVGGYLLLPPGFPVRLGVSAGAGLTFTMFTTPGMPLYTDVYLDVVNWWIETDLLGPILFLRQEMKYALGVGTNILGTGWMMDRFPVLTLGVVFRW